MMDPLNLNQFEPVTYQRWRDVVEREIGGADFEDRLITRVAGIEIQPLYTARDTIARGGVPGVFPYRRGARARPGWALGQIIDHSDQAEAARHALEAVEGGATWLALRFRCSEGPRANGGSHAERGVASSTVDDVCGLLDQLPLDRVAVSLAAGRDGFAVVAAFVMHARRRGIELAALKGSLGLDPLGTLAMGGELRGSLESAAAASYDVACWSRRHAPALRALTVNTHCYHDAGADAALELGIGLATGLAYLRDLTSSGLTLADSARSLGFEFAVGNDYFLEVAKLRAARLAWSRVMEVAGGGEPAQAAFITAACSRRTQTRRDPWVNMVRSTAQTFAAAVGGADVIVTPGFADAVGESDSFGLRMARNTQHLLVHEAHIDHVVDPAGGSFYVEALTEQLALKAWEHFQAIERVGGLARALCSGKLQRQLLAALERERTAVATRRIPIVGVSEFAVVDEVLLSHAQQRQQVACAASGTSSAAAAPVVVDAARFLDGADAVLSGGARLDAVSLGGSGTVARCRPLVTERLSEALERVRDSAEIVQRVRGRRPTVFLIAMGPVASHQQRATFARSYFEAGGVAVLGGGPFASAAAAVRAFADSGAAGAVLCSSDAIYVELVEPFARALRDHGARIIVLAGSPGPHLAAYRAAGVTDFIYAGINLVESLADFVERMRTIP